jgi:putative peptide zinc metalloprotease protein
VTNTDAGQATDLAGTLDRVVIAEDGDEFILGRPDLGIYVAVPPAGAELVRALQEGGSVAEAAARASRVASAEVDAEDFLTGLASAGLLSTPPDATGGTASGGWGTRTREIRWIGGVSPRVAQRLFGPVAWTVYTLAATFVVGVLATRPDLRPSYEHIWWLSDPVRSVLLLFPIALLLIACHEAWHWLAGRALGVPAIFRVSYRGIFLAFETDLTQLVTVPRRKRYSAFLAGMAFDLAATAVALAARLGHRTGIVLLPGWVDRLLAAIVLVLLLSVIWQWAAVFLRSDGYAVVANALRCHDLYRATWLTTKRRLWRLSEAETAEFASIGAHDRRVARWFALCYMAGLAVMAWLLFAFAIPFMAGTVAWVGHNLANPSATSPSFWESVAVVVVVVGRFAAIPLLAWRERRLRLRGALR